MQTLPPTIFKSPRLSGVLGRISHRWLCWSGWTVVGTRPTIAKYVLVGAPHTSNWDFILFLLVAFAEGIDLHWMGKDSLFPQPLRRIMMWLGGVPINRSQSNNMVEQMIAHYRTAESLVVVITPEGTRGKVARWRSGFYHLAVGAGVPIVLGFLDSEERKIGFGPVLQPSGDYDSDMVTMMAFYKSKKGLKPELGL